MSIYKSGNPALKKNTFTRLGVIEDPENIMTLQGTVNKVSLLLFAVFIPAIYMWYLFNRTHDFSTISLLFLSGFIGALIVGLIITFFKKLSPYLAIVYAVLEGLFLGGFSALMELGYPGIVFEALLLTFGICAVLLLIYKLELIKPSEKFKLFIVSATGGIAAYYLISLVLSFSGIRAPFVHDNSLAGIGFSLLVIVIAALNLIFDFDFIEEGIANQSPKYMEWYSAFGLMVTLIWLYIEMINLLSKLMSRD